MDDRCSNKNVCERRCHTATNLFISQSVRPLWTDEMKKATLGPLSGLMTWRKSVSPF